jgi:uncharacterized integral membrane protein
MKFLSWLITVPLIAICVFFAVSNRQDVAIDLWPTGYVVNAPLYLVSLGCTLLGFTVGALLFWLRSLPARLQRHMLNKQVEKLKQELHAEKLKNTPGFLSPP